VLGIESRKWREKYKKVRKKRNLYATINCTKKTHNPRRRERGGDVSCTSPHIPMQPSHEKDIRNSRYE
jgi:hypothetical protein